MKEKTIPELSKQELIDILENKWKNDILGSAVQILGLVIIPLVLLFGMEDSWFKPPYGTIHLSTFYFFLLIGLAISWRSNNWQDRTERKLNALIELLRKSNVINS